MDYYKNIPDEKDIIHNYDYLKSFDEEVIITIILKYFSEDEKKDILRNKDFINNMSSSTLNKIINSMSFISAFNMLQNMELVDKINDINIKLTSKDTLFIKEFLNSNLVNKSNHKMLKNMLITMLKEDVIRNLNNKDIVSKLEINDLIELSTLKHIDLVNDIYLIELLDKNDLENYINDYFINIVNYELINNSYVKKTLFNEDIDLDEVIYLYDYLTTKTNHNIKDCKHSINKFINVYNEYKKLGLDKMIKKINDNNLSLDDYEKELKINLKTKKTR